MQVHTSFKNRSLITWQCHRLFNLRSPICFRTSFTEHSPNSHRTSLRQSRRSFRSLTPPFGNNIYTEYELFRENKMKAALELWSKYSALRSTNDKKTWTFEISCFYLKVNKPVLCRLYWFPAKCLRSVHRRLKFCDIWPIKHSQV